MALGCAVCRALNGPVKTSARVMVDRAMVKSPMVATGLNQYCSQLQLWLTKTGRDSGRPKPPNVLVLTGQTVVNPKLVN